VAGSLAAFATRIAAFRQGLSALGYVEDQTIVLVYRYAEGREERLPELATALVQLPVDVLIAAGDTPVVWAALRATPTLPIVMTQAREPVAAGLVTSLAAPGGNVTGLTASTEDLPGTRLALLLDTVPQVTRVAVLWNPDDPATVQEFQATQAAAHLRGIAVASGEVRRPADFAPALAAATQGGSQALLVLPDPLTTTYSARLVVLAAERRLPGLYPERGFVAAGGLMAYGPDAADLFRRAATVVHKLLKGAKPATLPIEPPQRWALLLNRRAAATLGLAFPAAVLSSAAEVLQ
jgi:putative ABC transport system substrate-binding protein